MKISVDNWDLCHIKPPAARIYDGEGELVSARYILTAADDVAQTYDAEVDNDGVRLEMGGRPEPRSPIADPPDIETFSCPGLRIEGWAS